MVYYQARQYDRAVDHLKKTIEMDPHYVRTHFYLAQVYEEKGMFEEALAEWERGNLLEGDSPSELAQGKARIRNALGLSGARGYWRMRLEIVKEEARQGSTSISREILQTWRSFTRGLVSVIGRLSGLRSLRKARTKSTMAQGRTRL
jgi:tetratricopeptide (TPR) repeat protein